MGTEKIAFSGGEPLVWASIVKAVQTASEGGLKVTVYTSGNVSGIEELLRKLKDYGLNKLIFSIYSPKWQEQNYSLKAFQNFHQFYLRKEVFLFYPPQVFLVLLQ